MGSIPLESSPLLARLNVNESVVSTSISQHRATVDIAASAFPGHHAQFIVASTFTSSAAFSTSAATAFGCDT